MPYLNVFIRQNLARNARKPVLFYAEYFCLKIFVFPMISVVFELFRIIAPFKFFIAILPISWFIYKLKPGKILSDKIHTFLKLAIGLWK